MPLSVNPSSVNLGGAGARSEALARAVMLVLEEPRVQREPDERATAAAPCRG